LVVLRARLSSFPSVGKHSEYIMHNKGKRIFRELALASP
jgi:hypothetical protein